MTKPKTKPTKIQKGDFFRIETLVIEEMIAEGVKYFPQKPNNSRTANAERKEAKFYHSRR